MDRRFRAGIFTGARGGSDVRAKNFLHRPRLHAAVSSPAELGVAVPVGRFRVDEPELFRRQRLRLSRQKYGSVHSSSFAVHFLSMQRAAAKPAISPVCVHQLKLRITMKIVS